MSPTRPLVVFVVAALGLAGAGCGTPPGWHAGVVREDPEAPALPPTRPEDVALFFKADFGAGDETEGEERFMCGSTTRLRRAFLLAPEDTPPPPERDLEVLGQVTTEEFPRDEEASRILTDEVSSVFGLGDEPTDSFQVSLDPAFRDLALERLRAWGARVGADAVIDVFATGEAEHHMWHGIVVSFNSQSPRSPIYSSVRLLDLRLRDVRLHGTAVRYAD